MEALQPIEPIKTVRYIPPKAQAENAANVPHQQNVAAYCRVSTKMEEQLNSYEVQTAHYTEKINSNHDWRFAGIYADKGITGTSTKRRDQFNKMIRICKQGE